MPKTRARGALPLLMMLAPLWACADGPTAPSLETLAPAGTSARSIASLQSTPEGHIRIGVLPTATAIEVGAAGDFSVIDKASGAVLATGSGGTVLVELESPGNIDTRLWLQTACAGVASRDDWLARATALGYETYTEFVPSANCWRLRLGTQNQGWTARVAFKAQAIEDGLAAADAYWISTTIGSDEAEVKVSQGGWSYIATAPLVVRSDDGLVTIGERTYRGIGEVWLNSGGTLAGINELPLEEYLYGVVPRELPPVPYGLPEAQKAQAVTARTYALANLGKRGSDGYDLLPTTGDQVYGGYEDEHPVSTEAVDATTGIVAVHQGSLITTLYHSTSGGWTANSEDVYSAVVPYLRGVPDAERGRALEKVPSVEVFMRNANPINLRAAAAGDFEADWSRYHRWTVDWTADEMASILALNFGQPITEVRDIRVVDRADHGRVLRIEFDTDAGTFGANKDAIRWTLQYPDANGDPASLRSTLFFIEPIQDKSSKGVMGWKAFGGGWGHGVGMSQTGAVGMAEKGRSYEEILKHYYQGIELEQR